MAGGRRWNPGGDANPSWKGGVITDPVWFRERYEVDKLSLRQIAKLAERSVRTVARWAKAHGIKTRSSAEGKVLGARYGPDNPHWNPLIKRNCADCGGPVAARGLLGVDRRCRPCLSAFQSASRRGAANGNYQGIADIKRLVRQHSDKTWRPRVYERDNYACRRCQSGANNGNLRAHHILRFGVIVREFCQGLSLDTAEDRFAAANFLIASEAINAIGNGVTLCVTCHEEIHLGPRTDTVDWRPRGQP